MAVSKKTTETMEIHALKQGHIKLRMIGQTPMYFNSMGAKAWRDLLVGGGKKTAAQKKDIKHNPEAEFRDSVLQEGYWGYLPLFPCCWCEGCHGYCRARDWRHHQDQRSASDLPSRKSHSDLGQAVLEDGHCPLCRYEQDA